MHPTVACLLPAALLSFSCGAADSGGAFGPMGSPGPSATGAPTMTAPMPTMTAPMPTMTAPMPTMTAPMPTTTADSGPPPRDPNLRFDWPEAVPQGPCEAGVYEGTFSCSLTAGLFPIPFTVTGPVRFTLEESENGEFLEITDGSLDGNAMGYLFTADLAGKLDCVTNAFAADALNGVYGTFPFSGTFDGTLDAQLDRTSQTLNGQWSLAPVGFTPCVGPWSATKLP